MYFSELTGDGFIVIEESHCFFPVLASPIMELIAPVAKPRMRHRNLKMSDILRFDSKDGVPEEHGLEAVIVGLPYGDDTPSIKSRARVCEWQTASLRELVSWFKHTQFTQTTAIALGPNPDIEDRHYSYKATCGNAAPIFNYDTPGKLDVCVDPVWVDWPQWAKFLLVRKPQ